MANGDFTGGTCSGTTYVVNASGQFTATVPANGMLALHINARTTATSTGLHLGGDHVRGDRADGTGPHRSSSATSPRWGTGPPPARYR